MKALKSLGLPRNTSVYKTNAVKVLADNLLKNLPISSKKYTFNSVIQYYRYFIQTNAVHLTHTTGIDKEKILRSTNVCKAAGIDELTGHFPKDGSRPISDMRYLSIK